MSAVCLSPVSILRCIDLSLLDTKLLLIPPALELVFAAGLMFAGRGQGRQVLHLLVFCVCVGDGKDFGWPEKRRCYDTRVDLCQGIVTMARKIVFLVDHILAVLLNGKVY